MIVTDGGFNDDVVRRKLDLKYASIMKKQTGSRKQNKWEGNFESTKCCTFYKRYWTCRVFG